MPLQLVTFDDNNQPIAFEIALSPALQIPAGLRAKPGRYYREKPGSPWRSLDKWSYYWLLCAGMREGEAICRVE